ncbi:MAG TPA: TolC family protein [Gemmataceae bacterium]|nr:TolC family protein [Gemmataceae bacterium]
MRQAGLLLLLTLLVGCTRAHYRMSADREVYPILDDRAGAVGFATDRAAIEAAPVSRLADPTNPDKPPRPPDDPVAARYMERPNGMHGAHWPKKFIDWIELPGWEAGLPFGPDGKIKLDADKAFELALLNSREYQTALERLYLAALALTLNRYEFETQWFLRNATDFTSTAPGTPGETNTLTSNTDFGFSKAFAAGGQLVVDFANSFILEYTANGRTTVTSNFVATFVQPLLRGFGRRVRLEALTQAERDVLYAARDFYRFRKQFWADVTTLRSGYLSLLLQVQTIRNQQENLKGQELNLREYEELFRGGKITVVQVDQVFQSFQQGRLGVAQAEATLQTSLDQFKFVLGLPPRIPVALDDSVLGPFVLVDPKLEGLRDEIDSYQKARNRDLGSPPPVANLRRQYQEFGALAGRLVPFFNAVGKELEEWGKSLDRTKTDEAAVRVRSAYQQFQETFPDARKELEKLRTDAHSDATRLDETNRKEGWESLVVHTRKLLALTDQVIGVQTYVRINRIELPPVTWTEPDGLEFAHENRLDLMTEQARVTDAWRKVLVAANALRSELNVVASANLASLDQPGRNNLFDFSADAARYSVGVRFDGPLNRQAERNAYRAAQIAYQQARRNYMELSDAIEQSVRRDLRLLELERLNFEIARLNVVSAARQLEGARQQIRSGRDVRGTSSTLDILNAQNSLLNARNALASGYITYEQLRVQLLLDLEALRLDPHGYPIDERRTSSPAAEFAGDRCPRPDVAPDAPGPRPATLPPPGDGPPARLAPPAK